MSFFTEKQGEIEHEYFQAGPGKKIYLGRKDQPGSAKLENIRKALKYVDQKNQHYFEIADELILKLSQEDKDKIIPDIIDKFYKKADGLISSLSPSVAKQYKPKGQVKAEEETRRRQFELYKDLLKNVEQFDLNIIEDQLKTHANPIHHRPIIIIKENIATLLLYRRDVDFMSKIFSESKNLDELVGKLLDENINVEIEEFQVGEDITKQKGITIHALTYTKPTEKRMKYLLKKFGRELKTHAKS